MSDLQRNGLCVVSSSYIWSLTREAEQNTVPLVSLWMRSYWVICWKGETSVLSSRIQGIAKYILKTFILLFNSWAWLDGA